MFPALVSLDAGLQPLIVAAELLELLGSAGAVVLKGSKAYGIQIPVARQGWVGLELIKMIPRTRPDKSAARSVT